MATRKLASFPNTRIRPRPATREAEDVEVILPSSGVTGTPGTPTIMLAANENRTYFNIESLVDSQNTMRFAYAPLGTEGTPPPTLATDGFTLLPGAGLADEPSPQELWGINMCDVDGTIDVIMNLEEGEG